MKVAPIYPDVLMLIVYHYHRLSQHADVERLDFHHVLPNDLTPRQRLPPGYCTYRDLEREYWKVCSAN